MLAESDVIAGLDFKLVNHDDLTTQICLVLRQLQDYRVLLTVQVGDSKERFTSAVLEVVQQAGYLVLDELSPKAGHALIRNSPTIHVRGILNGLEVKFETRVAQVGQEGGLSFYKVRLPERIDYPQRRQSHRVTVPLATGVPISLLMPDERIVQGELRDISPEGLGMRVRLGSVDPKQDRGAAAICEVRLSKGYELVTDLELCHIDPAVRTRVPRLGARFLGLNPIQSRRIEQYCAELARIQQRLR